MVQCKAITKNGYQCFNKAKKNQLTCNISNHINQFNANNIQQGG